MCIIFDSYEIIIWKSKCFLVIDPNFKLILPYKTMHCMLTFQTPKSKVNILPFYYLVGYGLHLNLPCCQWIYDNNASNKIHQHTLAINRGQKPKSYNLQQIPSMSIMKCDIHISHIEKCSMIISKILNNQMKNKIGSSTMFNFRLEIA
jgi:hypothetical protein